jgi:hypothetical protein
MFKTLTGTRLAKLTVIAVAVFLIGVIVVMLISDQRKKSKNRTVRENLVNITLATRLYYDQNGEYSKSAMFLPATSCTGEMFTDIASGLVGLTGSAEAWPKGVSMSCQADDKYYAVSASLPKSIDGDAYWCVDATGGNGPTRAHQAQGDVTC